MKYVLTLSLLAIALAVNLLPVCAQKYPVITPENAEQLAEVDHLGRGVLHDIVWSPDGTTVAAASTIGTWLYDIDHLENEPLLLGYSVTSITAVDFSPDGIWLASGGEDNAVTIWQMADHTIFKVLERHTRAIVDIAWSPDGAYLAASSADRAVRIWDTATWSEQTPILTSASPVMVSARRQRNVAPRLTYRQGCNGVVESMAWSPDSTLLTASDDCGMVSITNIMTGEVEETFYTQIVYYAQVDIDPSGRLAFNRSNQLFIRRNGTPTEIGNQGAYVLALVFSPDGSRLAVSSENGMVNVWDVEAGTLLRTLTQEREAVGSVAWSPDGSRLASISVDGGFHIWDADSGEDLITFEGFTPGARSMVFNPDGSTLAVGYWDGTIRIWDVEHRSVLHTLVGFPEPVITLAFSPDESLLAVGRMNANVWLRDTRTWEIHAILSGHSWWIVSLNFSPNGTLLASGAADNTIRLWEVATFEQVAVYTMSDTATLVDTKPIFNPDGTLLVASGDIGTAIYALPGGEVITPENAAQLVRTTTFGSSTQDAAWSPEGEQIAVASWGDLLVFDLHGTGQVIDERDGRLDSVNYSPDGRLLVTDSREHSIRVWDTALARELIELPGHTANVLDVRFSPDGTLLVSASEDGTVRLWQVP